MEQWTPSAISAASASARGPLTPSMIGTRLGGGASSFTSFTANSSPAYVTRSPFSNRRTISTLSRRPRSGVLKGIPIWCSIQCRLLLPRPSTTRPGAIAASVAVSIATTAGCRVYGLTTPRPITPRTLTAAAAAATA